MSDASPPRPSPFQDYAFPASEGGTDEPLVGFRAFLRAWFEWAKSCDGGMSYARFGKLAGLGANSGYALKNVITGRDKLGAERQPKFFLALDLEEQEAEQLRLQIARDQASTPEERAHQAALVEEHRRRVALEDLKALPAGAAQHYLSSWESVTIRELAGTAGFVEDPHELARRLRGRLSPEQAAQTLRDLIRNGHLVRDGAGRLWPATETIRTKEKGVGDPALVYHRGMARLALDELKEGTRAPAEGPPSGANRYFAGVTLRLNPADQESLFRYIHSVEQHLLLHFDKASGQEVVQVNLQVFPLTCP